MASNKIEFTAIIESITHKAGGSKVVLGKFSTKTPVDELKRLATAKPKNKELVKGTIELVQKTLIEK